MMPPTPNVEYRVRSTRTGRLSRAYRIVDAVFLALMCLGTLALLFTTVFVPVGIASADVAELGSNELVLVSRAAKYIVPFKRGDIVRIDLGGGFGEYRVIALSGETVTVRCGRTYINGAYLDEGVYSAEWDATLDVDFAVPEGAVLVLPDDRRGISDLSCYAVDKGDIYGTVFARIFPISRLTLFG